MNDGPLPTSSMTDEFRKRDALTFKLLGAFFLVFGVLVLIGLFWKQTGPERLVSTGAGLLLLISGGVSFFLGRRRNPPP